MEDIIKATMKSFYWLEGGAQFRVELSIDTSDENMFDVSVYFYRGEEPFYTRYFNNLTDACAEFNGLVTAAKTKI
ncbi:hypothetical protein LWT83_14435 [Enterobacter hormaechei]|uniref:Uncharacterized protein n=1 Tax=Enterobacter hormaechei TaxID=158836 RepID=A0A9X7L2X8_9ENTR|nr:MULTISPECIES: hypothetical protein [Enterobacter]KJW99571.1 hypothetical protein RZ87_09550 [Enterobacter roggenkampii]SAF25847.1 Uncharacterised protein [Enterobacter cloacae]HCJ5934841.1 hypothetical protein [Escherichia coli]EHN8907527.1 hypothetical protein [Enterobacter hormaechei]EKS6534563.1 hypothetical protein [Enterobacter hormaechei]